MTVTQQSVGPRSLSMPTGVISKVKGIIAIRQLKFLIWVGIVGSGIYAWNQVLIEKGIEDPTLFSIIFFIFALVASYVVVYPESIEKDPPRHR